MSDVLKNSLFVQEPQKFRELKRATEQFNTTYNGNNIIQDDIFQILLNFAQKSNEKLELFRFPTMDDDFCAVTCVKKGIIFAYINSNLSLAKQIFAAGHELYHIWCFICEKDESVLRKGSFLNANSMNENVQNEEDREANAFAGLLLVPGRALNEQMDIYGISKKKQTLEDIICLMGIFAVPYKAILLRLYEEEYMDAEEVYDFLNIPKEKLEKVIGYTYDTFRWNRRTPEIVQMGNLRKILDYNREYELVPDTRIEDDELTWKTILKKYKRNKGE